MARRPWKPGRAGRKVNVVSAPVAAEAAISESIARTSEFVRVELAGESTGHDWWHAERVRALARHIAVRERADVLVVQIAALLHDLADEKFSGAIGVVRDWLAGLPVNDRVRAAVLEIVRGISYRGAGVADRKLSLAGRCVRDADRLDAMGAIGVARTFAYGGRVGRPIHDPGQPPVPHQTAAAYYAATGTTINHFHEKLLLLQDRLATPTGRELGRRRQEFMLQFLAQFQAEWDDPALLADDLLTGELVADHRPAPIG